MRAISQHLRYTEQTTKGILDYLLYKKINASLSLRMVVILWRMIQSDLPPKAKKSRFL